MFKALIPLFKETFRQWDAHRVPKMGAALSFYTVFSLAPLAILVLSLLSLAVERSAARAEIVGQFRNFVGKEGAEVMEMILTKTGAEQHGILGTVLGFVVLLIGASGVFGELQDSLNQIWNVSSKRHPVFILVKERVFSFAMVFVMGFLMLVSFMFSAAVAAAGNYLHGRLPGLDGPWEWGNAVISLLVIAMLFALIFRLIPDTRIAWGMSGSVPRSPPDCLCWGSSCSAFTSGAARWPPAMGRRVRSSSSWSGCSTPRRSCSSARPSRGCMPCNWAHIERLKMR
jgi:membrane protein